MILADEDDAQRIKDPPVASPTIRYPERAAGRRPCSPLPDYETSQALTYNNLNDSLSTLRKPPQRRRFLSWRSTLVALVVYILLTLVIGIPIIVKVRAHLLIPPLPTLSFYEENQPPDDGKYPSNSITYAAPWPGKTSGSYYVPNINNISSPTQLGLDPVCNNWTVVAVLDGGPTVQAWTENIVSSNGQFTLTLNASYARDFGVVFGDLYVGVNPDQSVQNTTLSIKMQISNSSVFDQTFTCFSLTENTTDLSLYVPNNLSPSDSILYNITLLFPQSQVPSQVNSFGTFLPLFDQHLGSFSNFVTFEKVSLEGPTSKMTIDSLSARQVFIETSMQPIVGNFYVSDSLVLSTILAPVEANITLYNDPDSNLPTFLAIDTGNSNLTSMLTLSAPNEVQPQRPNFIASMRTFYGTLNSTIVHDPSSPPTSIKVHAENGVGPSSLTLDDKFQGIFQVTTKQARALVAKGNAQSMDPWAPDLQRDMVTAINSTARMEGWIGWGDQPQYWDLSQQGEVVVDTSLADASLYFLG
ncbi:hypothetical protein F5141DRAFT_1186698 [Pisolithus sp. B1]|nr:hypothetical protein F5141DRAFT_1186698 [Pisolithus sp. B1]